MWIPWQWAMVIAAVLALSSKALRKFVRPEFPYSDVAAPVLLEAAVVMVLYSLWQFAGSLSVMGVDGALARGQWVIDVQGTMGLPSERGVQALFLKSPLLVQLSNGYYAFVHVPALVGTLFWGFLAHRQLYTRLRNTVVITTAGCLLIQLVPLAPPRMYPELGFVDTGEMYGQSVYNALGRGMAGQLAAMPSVHVAWAVIVSVFAVWFPCRVVWKLVGVLHGLVTVLVVVVTGNHFWLDGVVAVVLMLIALGVLQLSERRGTRIPMTPESRP